MTAQRGNRIKRIAPLLFLFRPFHMSYFISPHHSTTHRLLLHDSIFYPAIREPSFQSRVTGNRRRFAVAFRHERLSLHHLFDQIIADGRWRALGIHWRDGHFSFR